MGDYQLVTRCIDLAGNYKTSNNLQPLARRNIKLFTDKKNPPTNIIVTRTSNGYFNMTWKPPKEMASTTTYIVEWSTDPGFPESTTTTTDQHDIQGTNLILIPNEDVDVPVLTTTVVRARVRTSVSGVNDWSLPSSSWKTSSYCGDRLYLVDDVSDPSKWNCDTCPEGASCEGDVLWSGVRARFGYWRNYLVDASNVTLRSKIFIQCIYPLACLGAPAYGDQHKDKYKVNISTIQHLMVAIDRGAGSSTRGRNKTGSQFAKQNIGNDPNEECLKKVAEWNAQKLKAEIEQEDLKDLEEEPTCDLSKLNLIETCNVKFGHDNNCSTDDEGNAVQCRLCDRCSLGYQRESTSEGCAKCPDVESNRSFLSLGGILIILAVAFIVWLQIDNNGKGELSDGVKKIMLSWLQVSSMAASFPLKWPAAMEGLFVFQGVVSTVGQHLVDPDCELSQNNTPAEAFYKKNILYAFFPILCFLLPFCFWYVLSLIRCKCIRCGCRGRDWRTRSRKLHQYSNKDKAVLSVVVALYLMYPTTTLQVFSMVSCKHVGTSSESSIYMNNLWLSADLNEPCFKQRHILYFLFLVIPQFVMYVVGLPLISLYFLQRNRSKILSHDRVVMFRYGLIFAGYSEKCWYWEGIMALRKVVVVIVGVFGRLTDTQTQVHIALLVIAAFLLLHVTMTPFPSNTTSGKSVGVLETFALTTCFLTMWCGLLFFHGRNPIMSISLTIFLIVINVIFLIVGIKIFIREFAKEQDISLSEIGKKATNVVGDTFSMVVGSLRGEVKENDGDDDDENEDNNVKRKGHSANKQSIDRSFTLVAEDSEDDSEDDSDDGDGDGNLQSKSVKSDNKTFANPLHVEKNNHQKKIKMQNKRVPKSVRLAMSHTNDEMEQMMESVSFSNQMKKITKISKLNKMSKDKNKNGKRKKKKKGRSTMKPMVTTNELYCNVVKDVKDVKSTEVEMVVAGKVKGSGKFKGEEKKGKGNEEKKSTEVKKYHDPTTGNFYFINSLGNTEWCK